MNVVRRFVALLFWQPPTWKDRLLIAGWVGTAFFASMYVLAICHAR